MARSHTALTLRQILNVLGERRALTTPSGSLVVHAAAFPVVQHDRRIVASIAAPAASPGCFHKKGEDFMGLEHDDSAIQADSDWRTDLAGMSPENPALARLQQDLSTGASADQVITSYDRMHHRHNRS